MSDEANQLGGLARYARQIRFAPWGEESQRRLSTGRALVIGCGALGSMSANLLARAGVGHLRIVDRDFVELNNLQRQMLFDEEDVAAGLPKAIAAAEKLQRINSQIEIEPVVADVDHTNIAKLCDSVDVIVDGTDNFETRLLINDAAAQLRIAWLYGGAIGAEGQTMTILPGETPCLRCLMQEPPPLGATPTCDTVGVLGGAVAVIASIQAVEAMKILGGHRDAVSRMLTVIDLWDNCVRHVNLDALRDSSDCPTCTLSDLPWLEGRRGSQTAVLCGRNSVQLSAPAGGASLTALAEKLQGVGRVTRNKFLLRLDVDGYQITVFPDGRSMIGGTDDVTVARSVHAKYIGN